MCSILVRWTSSRDNICGPIRYVVQLIKSADSVLRRTSTTDLDIPLINLVPDTNYTITITGMDSTGLGMTSRNMFNTAMPKSMSMNMRTAYVPLLC